MTDNLSVNVNLNSQSQSSNLIENVSPDSLPSSSEMSTEEKLLSMETPMSRLLANSGGGLENAETPKITSLRHLQEEGQSKNQAKMIMWI
jgi:hypothetical protein